MSLKNIAVFCLFSSILTSTAFAEDQGSQNSTPPDDQQTYFRSAGNRPSGPQPIGELLQEGPTGGIWQRAQLLGDMGGVRSYLGNYGVSLNLQETSEVFG